LYTGLTEEVKRDEILPYLKKKIEEYYNDLQENKVIFAKPEAEEGEDKEKNDGKKKGKK